MKKILYSVLLLSLLKGDIVNIHPGWQMIGAAKDLKMQEFNSSDIKMVWLYDDNYKRWKVYSPDEKLMQLVENSQTLSILDNIPKYKGFWVFANHFTSIQVSNDENEGNDYYFLYLDVNMMKLQNITPDELYNKKFNLIYKGIKQDVYFDDSAKANFNLEKNDNYSLFIEDGCLTIVEKDGLHVKNIEKYKVLDKNSNGMVLGKIDGIGRQDIIALISDTTNPNPVDMVSKLPYKFLWDINSYSIFTNDNKEYYYNNGQISEYKYKIQNGKIGTILQDKENENGEYTKSYLYFQTYYNIINFDILKAENITEILWKTVKEGNLVLNLENITTWDQYFEETNWTVLGTHLYENNSTTEDGCNFEVLNNDKTLHIYCGPNSSNINLSLEDGKLKGLAEYYFYTINPVFKEDNLYKSDNTLLKKDFSLKQLLKPSSKKEKK